MSVVTFDGKTFTDAGGDRDEKTFFAALEARGFDTRELYESGWMTDGWTFIALVHMPVREHRNIYVMCEGPAIALTLRLMLEPINTTSAAGRSGAGVVHALRTDRDGYPR